MPLGGRRNVDRRLIGVDLNGDGGGLLVGPKDDGSSQREPEDESPQGQLPSPNSCSPPVVPAGHLHGPLFPSSALCLVHRHSWEPTNNQHSHGFNLLLRLME